MSDTRAESLRVDRWLWYARFFRTRTQAAIAVSGGHVKVNGDRARPGTRVAPGDRLLILRDRVQHDIVVRILPARRGPAAEAQLSFSEDESSVQRRKDALERIRQDRLQLPRTEGRPDKRTRRMVRRFNRQAGDN